MFRSIFASSLVSENTLYRVLKYWFPSHPFFFLFLLSYNLFQRLFICMSVFKRNAFISSAAEDEEVLLQIVYGCRHVDFQDVSFMLQWLIFSKDGRLCFQMFLISVLSLHYESKVIYNSWKQWSIAYLFHLFRVTLVSCKPLGFLS